MQLVLVEEEYIKKFYDVKTDKVLADDLNVPYTAVYSFRIKNNLERKKTLLTLTIYQVDYIKKFSQSDNWKSNSELGKELRLNERKIKYFRIRNGLIQNSFWTSENEKIIRENSTKENWSVAIDLMNKTGIPIREIINFRKKYGLRKYASRQIMKNVREYIKENLEYVKENPKVATIEICKKFNCSASTITNIRVNEFNIKIPIDYTTKIPKISIPKPIKTPKIFSISEEEIINKHSKIDNFINNSELAKILQVSANDISNYRIKNGLIIRLDLKIDDKLKTLDSTISKLENRMTEINNINNQIYKMEYKIENSLLIIENLKNEISILNTKLSAYEEILFKPTNDKKLNRRQAHEMAILLRNGGASYQVIQSIISEKLNIKVGFSTLSDWINDKHKPIGTTGNNIDEEINSNKKITIKYITPEVEEK
jgi:hypothetical protein